MLSRLSALACSFMLCTAAAAQSYPERTVVMVAPFPAGGSVDLVARSKCRPRLAEKKAAPGGTAFVT